MTKSKNDLFYAKVRNHPTCLSSALGEDNVPEAVYKQLVNSANDNLATLHRYLKLRGRMLGISDLRYHDIYPSLVSSDKKYPIEEGKRLVLEAVALDVRVVEFRVAGGDLLAVDQELVDLDAVTVEIDGRPIVGFDQAKIDQLLGLKSGAPVH